LLTSFQGLEHVQNGRFHNLTLLKDALFLYDVDRICLGRLFCISNTLIHSWKKKELLKCFAHNIYSFI